MTFDKTIHLWLKKNNVVIDVICYMNILLFFDATKLWYRGINYYRSSTLQILHFDRQESCSKNEISCNNKCMYIKITCSFRGDISTPFLHLKWRSVFLWRDTTHGLLFLPNFLCDQKLFLCIEWTSFRWQLSSVRALVTSRSCYTKLSWILTYCD